MNYEYQELKMQATCIILDKLFFQNQLPRVQAILIPCKKPASINIDNHIIFVDLMSDLEDHKMISYLLFELCQLYAFTSGYKNRTEIAIALANIMNESGFYMEDDEVKIEDRFDPESKEYKDLQEDILFTIKDLAQNVLDLDF